MMPTFSVPKETYRQAVMPPIESLKIGPYRARGVLGLRPDPPGRQSGDRCRRVCASLLDTGPPPAVTWALLAAIPLLAAALLPRRP
ncbi:hypothetical protein OG735_40420 [Streptomyces sp. NBC_01210]|uniref:hypothetical protein n=1 Tax=Streptomyces sp. NBC_01210 TaxID=2903774 RepID=UPI002E15AAB5|nr:hypothetical protein OG735_40420 [Streptomyces sp. NBC_01210]